MTDGAIQSSAKAGWRPSGRQIGMGVCVLILVLFAVVNLDDAEIDFLVDSVQIPLVFVITACALVGFLAGYLFSRHLEKKD
ncbi:MAG: LapA family protein [Acidimicrobiia bacterium]|nr:LapA family protein [Acidimicrobiia bacterium]